MSFIDALPIWLYADRAIYSHFQEKTSDSDTSKKYYISSQVNTFRRAALWLSVWNNILCSSSSTVKLTFLSTIPYPRAYNRLSRLAMAVHHISSLVDFNVYASKPGVTYNIQSVPVRALTAIDVCVCVFIKLFCLYLSSTTVASSECVRIMMCNNIKS